MDTKTSVFARNAMLDALAGEASDGYIRICGGKRPNGPMLAELKLGEPAFKKAKDGLLVSKDIYPEASAKALGKASWYSVLKADGETVLWDGDVFKRGSKGQGLELDDLTIHSGARVELHSITYGLPE